MDLLIITIWWLVFWKFISIRLRGINSRGEFWLNQGHDCTSQLILELITLRFLHYFASLVSTFTFSEFECFSLHSTIWFILEDKTRILGSGVIPKLSAFYNPKPRIYWCLFMLITFNKKSSKSFSSNSTFSSVSSFLWISYRHPQKAFFSYHSLAPVKSLVYEKMKVLMISMRMSCTFGCFGWVWLQNDWV